MESVIFKYSDFFSDDGGFDKIRKDFDALGDDLIKKAKEVREKTKFIDIENVEAIKDTEVQTEALVKAVKKYGDAKEDVNKLEKAFLEIKKKEAQTNEDQLNDLVALDKQLAEHRSRLKEINTLSSLGIKVDRDLNKERVEAELAIKRVSSEIRKQQSEVLKLTTLSKEEQKMLKAKLVLEKEEIKTLDDVRERMSALRLVVQSLDMKEQAEQIKAYNQEIDELTAVLSDNSDQFIQNKINVGNYEESIINALKSSDLFKTNISALDGVLNNFVGILTKTRQEVDEMETSLGNNATALQRFTISFGRLNTALKASIIGLVIVGLAGLASMFGSSRAGAVRMEKVMMSLSSSLITFGKVAKVILVDGFTAIFQALTFNFDGAKETMNKGMKEIEKSFEQGATAIVAGLEYIDRSFKIEDQVRSLNREIERMAGKLAIIQSKADDATLSLKTQLYNSKLALQVQEQLNKKQLEVAKKQLEVANNKVKQNALANVVEAKSLNLQAEGVAFAEQVQALAQRRGIDLEISNELIEEQQTALIEVIKAENELNLGRVESAKKTREINRDIFEQNLDLLIDLIDTEKNLSEQYVNDVTKNFKARINEFNRFLVVFRQNSQKELDEFTKEATNMGLNLDFQIEYDKDGNFKVFVNDQELALNNVVELNKQLQSTGMNEIDINRFREFMVETRNGVRDFRDLNKELKLAGINVKELTDNLKVDKEELGLFDLLNKQIENLKAINPEDITQKERKSILEKLEYLEKQKEKIIENAESLRRQNRIKSIDAELKLVEKGSQRELELLRERASLEKQVKEDLANKNVELTRESNEKAILEYEKFIEDLKNVLNQVLDKAVEISQKRVDVSKQEVEKQTQLIDVQRQRAEQGLSNTLAFEQRELGKREAELIKQEKRKERIEKVRALYTSYNNYASQGDKDPILKALRDFSILEAISASFGDGGVVEDKLPTNGIFKGQSHRGNQGGIPILVEGKEGIFSAREMDNLGKDNFYKMKDIASMGKVDSNFFSGQRKAFIKAVPVAQTDKRMINELREVKNAIESKPVQNYDIAGIVDGVIEVVETIHSKNKTQRNIYKTRKPRL